MGLPIHPRVLALICCSIVVLATFALYYGKINGNNHADEQFNNLQPDSSRPVLGQAVLDQPIQPIFMDDRLDKNKVALGELLFHDPILSADNTVTCASCHNLAAGGSDNRVQSIGIKNRLGNINSPTVFNSSLNIAQFWDGRADTLEEQIDGPVHNEEELGTNWLQITAKLKNERHYTKLFNKIYSDGISENNIKDAIASFERSLLTVNSPFDKYLLGDTSAISENAIKGYDKFKEYGCIACHQGSNVGGNLYQPMGLMGNYFKERETEISSADLGRHNVTGLEEDKFVFRVPSLRLSTLTAPYFHDGSAKTLKDAVQVMIKYQLGRQAPEEDEDLIIEFLHTLVGEYKGRRLDQ